jgi:hypothetical protein
MKGRNHWWRLRARPGKNLSLNKLPSLNPPLEKGDIGGFALARFGKIPPTPLYKGGNIIYGQALRFFEEK